jgi:hypothetical protein
VTTIGVARGNTPICGRDGDVLAGPLEATEGIVYSEIDAGHARKTPPQFDPVGHYARSDVLRLLVDRERSQRPSAPARRAGPGEKRP